MVKQRMTRVTLSSFLLSTLLMCYCFTTLAQDASDMNSTANSSDAMTSADASFTFIANTLQTYKTTGRIATNLGLDGADYVVFLEIIEASYRAFTQSFAGDSPLCEFYLDPKNSIMTIEDRATMSFIFLADLPIRRQDFIALNEIFQEAIAWEFGTILLNNIERVKTTLVSGERLPSIDFDEAGMISFADTACI